MISALHNFLLNFCTSFRVHSIDDGYKEIKFEPFSQVNLSIARDYKGVGLSLALAYEYWLLNNFKMRFESEKGQGTKFILEFDKYDIDNFQ